MHNLIMSRAVFEILKKPLPHTLRFYKESNMEESERVDEEFADSAGFEDESAGSSSVAQLNVNAREFVPRFKENINDGGEAGEEHDETMKQRKTPQPKLLLPWKGFPKPMRPERANKPVIQNHVQSMAMASAETRTEARLKRSQLEKDTKTLISRKQQHLKDKAQHTKGGPSDEKRLEQERKVALEALKLVEQRRVRESLDEKPQIIVHLTRSPVDFTPEERERVDRLRLIKREHIERVLREMRHELKMKQHKVAPAPTSCRYISLQRAVKPATEPAQQALTAAAATVVAPELVGAAAGGELGSAADVPPRRYIPTVKQWDERCRAKAYGEVAGANKENNMTNKPKLDDNMASEPQQQQQPGQSVQFMQQQRAMVPSSLGNIMPKLQAVADLPCKDRKLFVPRYWPPTPMVAAGEIRRGNLTHARNISRAFANCGLLPTPMLEGEPNPCPYFGDREAVFHVPHAAKPVKRYTIEELLQWEPQPHELQKPDFNEAFYKLGFMCQ